MLDLNFSPFPVLKTKRLLLRQLQMEDAAELFRLRSSEEAMRYIPRPPAKSVDESKEFIGRITESWKKNEAILWCICLNEEPGVHIGNISFWKIQSDNHRAELGYMLHPSMHGRGIMYEALQPVLDYGFRTMNLHSAEAQVDPRNTASIRLLLKSGFRCEAGFRENIFFEGQYMDTEVYSLLANDWKG